MAETDKAANDELKKLDLSTLPDKANVHIHMPSDEPVAMGRAKEPMARRGIIAIVTGAIGAVVGYVGGRIGYNVKMSEFEREVEILTKNSITNRNGLGAGMAEGFSAGGAVSGHSVFNGHYAEQSANVKKYGKLPKLVFDTFRGSGKEVAALTGAAVLGTAAAAVGYAVAGPDPKKPEATKDWADKVSSEKDEPRSLS